MTYHAHYCPHCDYTTTGCQVYADHLINEHEYTPEEAREVA